MLDGWTALIVEEEFLIALDIQRMLEAAGAAQTLFARTPDEATQMRHRWPEIAVAVIEVRLGHAEGISLAQELVSADVPVVVVTADLELRRSLAGKVDAPVINKPVPEDLLLKTIQDALASR